MNKEKIPLDFSELTQEDIDEMDNYKKVDDYDLIDFLQAIVDSEKDEEKIEEEKSN